MDKENRSDKFFYKKADIEVIPFLSKLLNKWYWIVLSGVLGISIAFVFSKMDVAKYEVSSTIIMKTDDDKQSIPVMFNDTRLGNTKSSLINQIGILKSYQLSNLTIVNLNWVYSWYKKGVFKTEDLYGTPPFRLELKEGFVQKKDLPIEIKKISETEYSIKIEGEVTTENGQKKEVTINQNMEFGKTFENELFHFTLYRLVDGGNEESLSYILYFNKPADLAQRYQNKLQVNLADENSDLIYVKLEGEHAQRDVDYLNELAKVYVQFGLDNKNKAAETTINFIDDQLASITDSLGKASDSFTAFRSKNRIVDLSLEAKSVADKLEEVGKEEDVANLKFKYFQNLEKYLKGDSKGQDIIVPSVVGVTDPTVNTLVLKLGELYNQREVLSFTVQEGNSKFNELDKEINYTKKILGENLLNLLKNTRVELQSLNERRTQANKLMAKLPKIEQDLIEIKRSFDLNDELYTFLIRKRAETGIIKASNRPDASILDEARVDSAQKISPGKIKILLMGAIFGGGSIVLLLFFLEYYDLRIQSVKNIEDNTETPIIGYIADDSSKHSLPAIYNMSSSISEAFRSLRFNIYHMVNHKNHQVISVLSEVNGEGKSFVASNLASVLAKNRKKVLFIDTDLKKPNAQKIFSHKDNQVGLSSYLSKQNDLKSVLKTTKVEGLMVMPSGPVFDYSSDLYNDDIIGKMIEELKSYFDYIIIDTPSHETLSDGFMFGRHSDLNIFVFRLGYSKKKQFKSFHKIVSNGVVSNIVTVLNGFKADS